MAAANALELSLKIQAAVEGLGEVSKLANEIEQLGGDATEVREKAAGLAEQMAALGKQQGLIDQFNQLSGQIKTAEQALKESTQRADELSKKFKDSAISVSALQASLETARQALADATSPEDVKRLNTEIKSLSKELKNAERVSNVLRSQLKNTEEATDKWSEKLQMSREELQKLNGEMRAAGIDASNLDKAQAGLTTAFKQADSAAEGLVSGLEGLKQEAERLTQIDMARGLLDVQPAKDMRAEIQAVRDAFETLKASGTLSEEELGRAALNAAAKIKALGGDAQGLSAEFDRMQQSIQDALNLKTLDLKPFRDTQAEIQRIREAYDALKASGTLTGEQLGQAALSAAQKIDALGGDVAGLSADFDRLRAAQAEALALKTLNLQPLRDTEAEIQKIVAAYDALKSSGTLSGDQLAKAALAAKQQIAALSSESGQATATMNAMEKEAAQAASAVAKFGATGPAFEQVVTGANQSGAAMRKAGQDIDDGSRIGKAGTESLSASIRNVIASMAGLGAGYLVFEKLKEGAIDLITTGAKFEQLDASLKSLTGSTQAAAAASQWIKDFAKNTPLEIDGVTDAYRRLKAFGIDPASGSLQAIVDTNAKAGGSQEQLERIVLALGQAWAKQKLQGDEILQLVEAGVPVWDLLAKATGKNVAELNDLSSKGKLGRDVIQALMDEMGRQNAGAAAEQMATFNGQVSNAKDNWTQFLLKISDAGVLDFLKTQVASVNAAFDEWSKTGKLQQTATEIGGAIISIATAMKDGVVFIHDHASALANLIAIAAGFKLAGIVSELAGMGAAMIAATASTEGAAAALSKFTTVLRAAGYGAIALELAALVGNVIKLNAAQEKETQASEDAAQAKQALKDRIAEVTAATRQYADTSIASSDQLQAKNKAETADYLEALQQAQQYWNARAVAAGNDAQASAEAEAKAVEYSNAIEEAAARVAALNTQTAAAAPVHEKEAAALMAAKIAAAETTAQLLAQGQSTEAVTKATKELLQGLDLTDKADLSKLAFSMANVANVSDKLGKAVKEEVVGSFEKLKATDLQVAMNNARAGMLAAADGGKEFKAVLDIGLRAAMKDFGLDADSVLGGTSEKVRQSVAAFQTMRQGMADAGASAQAMSNNLSQVLTQMLSQVKTTEDLKLVEQQWNETMRAGGVNAVDAIPYYDALTEARKRLAKSGQEVGDSFHREAEALTDNEKRQAAAANAAYRTAQAKKDQAEATQTATNAADQEGVALTRQYDLLEVAINTVKLYNKGLGELYENTVYRLEPGFMGWEIALREVNAQFELLKQEKAYVDDLTVSVNEAVKSGKNLAWAAMQTTVGFAALDSQHLEGLQSGIDAAKQKLQSLEDAAKSTVNSVLDELDQFNGNLVSVENRSYEARKSSLEALLKQAQDSGSTEAANDYRDALSALEQLHRAKLAKLDGKRADGGDVDAGKTYLTGEDGIELYVPEGGGAGTQVVGRNGPQIFVPPKDGYIVPNDELTKNQGTEQMLIQGAMYGGMEYLARQYGVQRQGGQAHEIVDKGQFDRDLIAGKLDPKYDTMIRSADIVVKLRGSLSAAWRRANPDAAKEYDDHAAAAATAAANQNRTSGYSQPASNSSGTPSASSDYDTLTSAAASAKSRIYDELAQYAGGGYSSAPSTSAAPPPSSAGGGPGIGGAITLILQLPNGKTDMAYGDQSSLAGLISMLSAYGYTS